MFLFLELKLFVSFDVFTVHLDILLLTVLVISMIDDGFQFRVSRLHLFFLTNGMEKFVMLSINLSCHVRLEID